MGSVHYDPDKKEFTIMDVYLLKQEVGAATTDLDATALGQLEYEQIKNPFPLRFWWHSHVKMQAFWSGTDVATIKDNGKNGWMLATVVNQKEEMRTALAYKSLSEFGESVEMVDNIETIIYEDAGYPYEEWDKEFETKVTTKKFIPMHTIEEKINKKSEEAWGNSLYDKWDNNRSPLFNPLTDYHGEYYDWSNYE